ncbi:hypothetical protein Tco_0755916 [Tanacetum coccineum]
MGGFWIMMEFQSKVSKENLLSHVGVASWFSNLQQASELFYVDERVAWVDIEGVPMKAWMTNTFTKIISKCGDLIYEDDKEESYFHRKRVCIKTKMEGIIFESFKIIVKEGENMGVQEEFVPQIATQKSKEDGEISMCFGHFQKVAPSQSQGSFLLVMEDLVKGNSSFDYICGPSVGNSGGILCVSDPFYAPHELSKKKVIWDYLHYTIDNRFGEVNVVNAGQWSDSNISNIVNVLKCFFYASGIHIIMHKSKLMGIAVDDVKVKQAAHSTRCERLTLLKSVLGSTPIYYVPMFKVPLQVLKKWNLSEVVSLTGWILMKIKYLGLVGTRCWRLKKKGGLGVSSFYAMNRALMFKWVRKFRNYNTSLWVRVIKAMHGDDGLLGKSVKSSFPSIWIDIIRELINLKNQGIDLLGLIKKKIGNSFDTPF